MRRAVLACALFFALSGPALAFGADDLVGTWHVLVHYQDSGSENPETKRWEDRIWVFEKKGADLHWVDYPIVVFDDDAGRFEPGDDGRVTRVLHYWEPNAAQQKEIRAGLAINSRGARSKTLRGSDAKGWTSARRGGTYKSTRVITYEETWSVDSLPDKPRFERQDSMGAAGSEDFEGGSLYETTEIAAGGDVLRGSFDRDGKRKGTFRLTRSGAVHSVSEKRVKTADGKEQSRKEFIAMLAPGLDELPGERSEADWRTAVRGPRAQEERLALRAALEGGLRTQVIGGDDAIRAHYTLLTNLAVELERLFAEDGKSLAELQKMMKNGEVDPGGVD